MSDIIGYLKQYFKSHFHLGLYLSVALFLGCCIFLNFSFDLEKNYIRIYNKSFYKWLLMSLETGFPFLVICGLLYIFGVNKVWVKSKEFWILFVFGFIIIGWQRSFFFHYSLLEDLNSVDRLFVRKVLWWVRPFITTFIPVVLFYNFYEKPRDASQSWYGLSTKNTDFKPYIFLIIGVFVLMSIAATFSDLAVYYPLYERSGGRAFAEAHGFNEIFSVLLYEFVYGFNFLSIETFFRGFLVLGFIRVLGGHAVLAMVGSYVFLHFGKPISECVSSAFGGYFIGILAFYSKRIWGGVALHVALAWSMEFFAWLQKYFEN
ncbi:MAG: hypothetical protein JXR07_03120 [Reichenbachiella sp.]